MLPSHFYSRLGHRSNGVSVAKSRSRIARQKASYYGLRLILATAWAISAPSRMFRRIVSILAMGAFQDDGQNGAAVKESRRDRRARASAVKRNARRRHTRRARARIAKAARNAAQELRFKEAAA